MKGRRVQKVLAAVLAVAMVLPMTAIPAKAEEAEEVTYKLYPNPQEMTYQDGSYILKRMSMSFMMRILTMQQKHDLKRLQN